jgi:dipeptidyl aminopeptidase/acylaminoacyl peptidase
VPLLERIEDAWTFTGAVQFDVADSGTLLYVPASIPETVALTWVDRDGREEPVGGEARAFRQPRVSPDGTRIAVEVEDSSDTNIWVGDRSGIFTPLTLEAGHDSFPLWSPDGLRIVFFSARNGGGLFARGAGGSGRDERLVSGAEWQPSGWAPDGRLIYERLLGPAIQLGTPDADGDAQQLNLVDDPDYFDVLHPAVSPNGRWLAYHSSESGTLEVYLRPFPNVNEDRRRVSIAGGYSPVWSRDGRELYYIRGNAGVVRPVRLPRGTLESVRIDPASGRAAAAPEALFSLRNYVFFESLGRQYDVAPDGRFLMVKDTTPGPVRLDQRMVLIQNWFQDLQRLVPR